MNENRKNTPPISISHGVLARVCIIVLCLGLPLMACKNIDDSLIEPDINKKNNAGYTFFKIAHRGQDSLQLAAWFPTLDEEEEYRYNTASTGMVVTGKVSHNAREIAGIHPAIIFSHGFSGGGIGSVEICEALARAGYYVFAPDHGDALMSVRIQGQSKGTLSEALDYLNDHPFGNGDAYGYRVSEMQSIIAFLHASSFNIDKRKFILGGHSMGGWTVMKTVENGYTPIALFFFSMGELHWLHNHSRYFESHFFQDLDCPTAYFYGGSEYGEAIAAGLHNVYAAYCFTYSPSPSYGLLVKGGTHFTYNSRAVAPGSYGSTEQLQSINYRLINFLNRHGRGMNITVTKEPEDVTK